MFTGIIQGMVPVRAITWEEELLHFSLHLPDELVVGLITGASVAVNGVA